jgi:type II secretory pathway pseudopilin PulG
MPIRKRERGYSLVDLLVVLGLVGLITGLAIPLTDSALRGQRIRGDAQALNNLVGLAKMRAASGFTRARVRANLTDRTFMLERWDKAAGAWVAESGPELLFRVVQFGFGGVTAPPPDTQAALAQSPACRVGIVPASAAIGNTACIVFNSRGLPVDGDGALFGGHAIYITDGNVVYATTVTATPRLRLWASRAGGTNWTEQQ